MGLLKPGEALLDQISSRRAIRARVLVALSATSPSRSCPAVSHCDWHRPRTGVPELFYGWTTTDVQCGGECRGVGSADAVRVGLP